MRFLKALPGDSLLLHDTGGAFRWQVTQKGQTREFLGTSNFGGGILTLVTDKTPPGFLVHTATDPGVPFQNSVIFAEALRAHGVAVELHVFDHGPHGFGLGKNDEVLKTWPALCETWMRGHGWLKK